MYGISTPLSDICFLVCFPYFVTVKAVHLRKVSPSSWLCADGSYMCPSDCAFAVLWIVLESILHKLLEHLVCTGWLHRQNLQLISKLFLTSLQSFFHCKNPGAYCWIFLLFINKNRFPDHNTFFNQLWTCHPTRTCLSLAKATPHCARSLTLVHALTPWVHKDLFQYSVQ
jgi:hypothetical protein